MKILVTCSWYVPHVMGGAETRINTICRALAVEHDVRVYCRNNRDENAEETLGGVRINRQKFYTPKLRSFRKIMEYCEDYRNGMKIGPDFDICISTSFGYTAALKTKYPHKTIIFLVTTLVNNLEDINEPGIGIKESLFRRLDLPINGFMEKTAFSKADKVIVSSQPVYEMVIKQRGITPDKITLMPQAIDIVRFSGKRDRRKLDSLGISGDKFIILAVSGLWQRKNLSLLIKSLTFVGDDFVAIVVGEGDKRLYLEKLARDMGVDKKIIFTGEAIAVEDYYAAADIFVHPSVYEPFGNVLLEAMAFGLPCVGLAMDKNAGILTANDEIIKDDVGFCIKNDERELAAVMQRLHDDQALRLELSHNARMRVETKYESGKYVANILAVGTKKKRLKVMYVVHSLSIGGTEKLIYDIVEAISSHGVEPIVCCLDSVGEWGERLKAEGFKVFDLARRPGMDLSVVARLRELIKKEAPDVLNPHQYTPYFYTIAAVAFMIKRPKVVFTEHGRFYPDRVRPKRVIFNQLANLFTDELIGVSEFSKRALVKYEWFPEDRIKVVYNGIKTEKFSGNIDIVAKRKSIGLSPDDVVIGAVGRLCVEKNYPMLLRAAQLIDSSSHLNCGGTQNDTSATGRGSVKFVIVGGGELESELKALAAELGLGDKVIFLGPRQDVQEIMKTFDVFAMSSDSEGASLVLLEAMASGLPIVATDVGGSPELIVNGLTGSLVPRGDHFRFSKAILDLLRRPDVMKKMSESGMELVNKRFSFNMMVENYTDIYQNLVMKTASIDKQQKGAHGLQQKRAILFILSIAARFFDIFKRHKYPVLGPGPVSKANEYIQLSSLYQVSGIKVITIDNKKLVNSRFKFYYQVHDEPKLKVLREKYGLDHIVAGAGNEIEKLIALREWTRLRFKNDEFQPAGRYFDALDILEQNRHDIHEYVPFKTYSVCNAMSFLYIQILASMGYTARAISLVDELGNNANMHCATEVWSDAHGKWFLMDPFLNLYYEREGVPLNALEIHNAIISGYENIHVMHGKYYGEGYQNPNYSINELIGYFKHMRVEFRNDWMTNHYFIGHPKKSDKVSVWWSDKDFPVLNTLSHRTSDPDDLYWNLDQVEISVKRMIGGGDSDFCELLLRTLTPNFKSFEIVVDGKESVMYDKPIFVWNLHGGENRMSVVAVNEYLKKGPSNGIKLLKE